jgi:zeaxanthin glucosyltransferase
MKTAFVTFPIPGHLNPTITLARKLRAREHDVVIVSFPDAESHVSAAQLPFVPFCEEDFPVGSSDEIVRQLSKLEGEVAVRFTMQTAAKSTESLFKSLPTALAEVNVDAVVLDTAQPYAGLVPMQLGLPFAHISNALHLDFSGHTPLNCFDWPHETTPEALARNREGVAQFQKMLEPAAGIAKEYARGVGLTIDWSDPNACISKLAWLTQTPKEFDFNSPHWPPQFHHTGPYHDGAGRIPIEFPWERLTGEPLVYASMGTLQNGLVSVFREIAGAARTHKGFQFVLSIGSQLEPEQISPVPHDAIVVKSAPQLEILKRASLCITHGGLNTTLESLSQGIPLVAIPVTNDQPGVAARIADKKVGMFVPSRDLTASRLANLIDDVMTESTYRENARRIQRAIAKTDGLSVAADLLERAFGFPTNAQFKLSSPPCGRA